MVHVSFFHDKYMEEELTSQRICIKIFIYTTKLISKMTLLLYSYMLLYLSEQFFPYFYQCQVFFFLGQQAKEKLILTCISLTSPDSEIEHCFICLLAICVSIDLPICILCLFFCQPFFLTDLQEPLIYSGYLLCILIYLLHIM